jgi:hypothetical protein
MHLVVPLDHCLITSGNLLTQVPLKQLPELGLGYLF